MEIFNELEQNSPEWFKVRCGLVTASEFSQVLAKGKKKKDGTFAESKTRRTLMLKKAGERITGESSGSYSNIHMERGSEQEPIARELYITQSGNEVTECGFMRDGAIGYSPDGLVGKKGLIEIKSRLTHIQAETLIKNEVPTANIAQIQGGLLISKCEWLDYISYCPGMPLFIKRVYPDLTYQENLTKELEAFEVELQEMVNLIISKF